MAWEQWTQTVITSGDVRYIRLWDAERELKSMDIPTGADCSVSCIDSTYAGTGTALNYSYKHISQYKAMNVTIFLVQVMNNITIQCNPVVPRQTMIRVCT